MDFGPANAGPSHSLRDFPNQAAIGGWNAVVMVIFLMGVD